jgi:hypothetical protein
MAYITKVPLDEATGRLKKIYDAGMARSGDVAQIIQVMSLDPNSCQGSMQFYVSLMKTDNALPAMQKEMLATVVSNINDCFY